MLEIINLSDNSNAKATPGVQFSRRVFKMLSKRNKDAAEILQVIEMLSKDKRLHQAAIGLPIHMLAGALGMDTDDLGEFDNELTPVEDSDPRTKRKKTRKESEAETRKHSEAEAYIKKQVAEVEANGPGTKGPATPDMPSAASVAKRMDFGKGVMAGLVAFAAGASMAGGVFGGGELEAPMPPAIPMSSEQGPASVGSIASAPAYLMDKSAISNRMNVRDSGSPQQFLGRANAANANANVSINDRSLNDAQYLSEYQNRSSGRF
jgi:hypothetical protein